MRPAIVKTWMLYHDNAPCHTALLVNEFWQSKYSCCTSVPLFTWIKSLWLLSLPKIEKKYLKEHHFVTLYNIKKMQPFSCRKVHLLKDKLNEYEEMVKLIDSGTLAKRIQQFFSKFNNSRIQQIYNGMIIR